MIGNFIYLTRKRYSLSNCLVSNIVDKYRREAKGNRHVQSRNKRNTDKARIKVNGPKNETQGK